VTSGPINDIDPYEAAEALAERRAIREHLSPMIKRVLGTVDPGAVYRHNWHIDLMSEYLEACYHREILRLIINIGPRFLKSICTTIGFPAWVHGQQPNERILTASGVADLSLKHSMDTRKVMREPWYRSAFPDVGLSEFQDAKKRYETSAGGHRIAVSVGGSSIGEGGRIKIIDDPIDPNKAFSRAEIDAVNRWYTYTWSTRSDDPKSTVEILVMQRLDAHDLTGHLLDIGGYEHLIVPNESPSKTTVIFPRSGKRKIRAEGELLQPSRIGPDETARIKKTIGTYGYTSQYQQKPTIQGGNRIKIDWFRRHKTLPHKFDEIIQSWDTANKAADMNNPSVCETFGRVGSQWFLIDLFKDRLVYPELKAAVRNLAAKFKPDTILVEDKASGQQIIQEMGPSQHNSDPQVLPILGVEPSGDKPMRMERHLASIEAGVLSIPDPSMNVPWLFDLEVVLKDFPKGKDWDEIDSMSQFLLHIRIHEATQQGPITLHSLTKSSTFRSSNARA
jgi:predicted phage terminase large subunit-like protein